MQAIAQCILLSSQQWQFEQDRFLDEFVLKAKEACMRTSINRSVIYTNVVVGKYFNDQTN